MENDASRAELGIDMTIISNGKVDSPSQQDCCIITKMRISTMEAPNINFRIPLINRIFKVGIFFNARVTKIFTDLDFAVQDEFAAVEEGQLLVN
jgi:hypothetical protein